MNEQALRSATKAWCESRQAFDNYNTFNTFVESLKREGNQSLLESVQSGVNVILTENGFDEESILDKFSAMLEAAVDEEQRQAEIDDTNKPTNWKAQSDDGRFGPEVSRDDSLTVEERKAKRAGTRAFEQEFNKLRNKAMYSLRQKWPQYANQHEDMVGELMIWAAKQAPKFNPNGTAKFSNWLKWEQQLGKYAGKYAGTKRGDWEAGERPQTGYMRHNKKFYKLVDMSVSPGDPSLTVLPDAPQGDEVWEEVDRSEYIEMRGDIRAQDLDAPIGGGGANKDMTVAEVTPDTQAGSARDLKQDDKLDLKQSFTQLSKDLDADAFNQWAVEKGATKAPINAKAMIILKEMVKNPKYFTDYIDFLEFLNKKYPELKVSTKSTKAGEGIHPNEVSRAAKTLAPFFNHEDWSDYGELKDIMNGM